jgi:colicin import membrane protein
MASAISSHGADTGAATCMFPGCSRPVRERAGEGGGKPPLYCDQLNPNTGKLAHTPLTAARERARRERQSANGHSAGLIGETPASAARERAAGLLEQFRTGAEQLTRTLAAAIDAMTSASDPESVSTELTAARRQVERARLEADERIQAIETARDQALAETAAARQALAEALAARDEAIAELDTLDAALTTTRAELDQTHTELAALRLEHRDELAAVRRHAAEQVSAAEQRATEQVRAAETARDQALAEASAARQAATDATNRAEEAREELRQARTEHRDELAAERARADTALDAQRAEHRRETETLQTVLTMLRKEQ